jgi:hypothetical protein
MAPFHDVDGTEDLAAIGQRLLDWYERHRRDLPWRRTRDPYAIWVAEIMLQQTRVETVVEYFERFLACFPTLADLARASLDDVLKAWEGLGYYARARNLHRAARLILQEHGELPDTPETCPASVSTRPLPWRALPSGATPSPWTETCGASSAGFSPSTMTRAGPTPNAPWNGLPPP